LLLLAEMTDQVRNGLNNLVQGSAAWIAVGGGVIGVISFFMGAGMWLGPIKSMPAQYEIIIAKLSAMEKRLDQSDWAIENLKSRADALAGQLLVSAEDRAKIWDRLRSVDGDAGHLKATSLSREDFVEWVAAMSARNKTLSIPPLVRNRNERDY
jgi:hypothetical protein